MKYMLFPVLASGATAAGWSDIQGILTPITSQFSMSTIVGVIAGLLGVTAAFIFLWWGVRKAFSAIMAAVRNGKAKI